MEGAIYFRSARSPALSDDVTYNDWLYSGDVTLETLRQHGEAIEGGALKEKRTVKCSFSPSPPLSLLWS